MYREWYSGKRSPGPCHIAARLDRNVERLEVSAPSYCEQVLHLLFVDCQRAEQTSVRTCMRAGGHMPVRPRLLTPSANTRATHAHVVRAHACMHPQAIRAHAYDRDPFCIAAPLVDLRVRFARACFLGRSFRARVRVHGRGGLGHRART
eukprot:6175159-Pleurochrysis_carterae.AAC.3